MFIKNEILDVASKLFQSYGTRSVTMDEVAGNLGMSKKTLYQHFTNKSELVQQIMLRHVEQDAIVFAKIHEASENAIEEIKNIAQHIIDTLRKTSPTLMHDLQKYYTGGWCTMQHIRKQQMYDRIKANLERGIQEELYRKEIDPDILAKIYVASAIAISGSEFFPLEEYPKYKVVEMFMNYHIHGVASSKGLIYLENKYGKPIP